MAGDSEPASRAVSPPAEFVAPFVLRSWLVVHCMKRQATSLFEDSFGIIHP